VRYLHRASVADAAETLGVSPSTIKSRTQIVYVSTVAAS
jgi:DNA-directed RNA polymerase specialized sigma24 family protein